jgi:protocatechuate 3,4-dioxygenase beta subunit
MTISPKILPKEAAMPPPVTPSLFGRRLVVSGLAATAAGPLIPGTVALARTTSLTPTPGQTTGPFYPVDWSGDADADLVRVSGEAAHAQGVVMHLSGRVLDARGEPLPGAVVEIWQCDALGRYRHPRDRPDGRDPGFQGRGRVPTGPDGGYAFRTIRPVSYPGRTPHIHVAVIAPGRASLVTQFYVAGEPLNQRDGLFSLLRDPRHREAVLLRLEPADRIETDALLASRDIVLG